MKTTASKLTAAQTRVVEAIRSGSMKQAWTGTHDGNIVRRLVRAGVVTAARVDFQKSERTYWGATIPSCVNYIGLGVA